MFQGDDHWSHLEDFAKRFSLEVETANPQIRELFEPSVAFASSLLEMVAELHAQGDQLTDFDRDNARKNLLRAAQHLLESTILAVSGMYTSSSVVYRVSIESFFQATYTCREIESRLGSKLAANPRWFPVAEYCAILKRNAAFRPAAGHLHGVYKKLSKLAHGEWKDFNTLERHLHSLPRFAPKEAAKLSKIMIEGNAAAGALIRGRFDSLFKVANVQRAATFDRCVARLQSRIPTP
jgi:hypothetical protein